MEYQFAGCFLTYDMQIFCWWSHGLILYTCTLQYRNSFIKPITAIFKYLSTPNYHLLFSFEEFYIISYILIQEVHFQGHMQPWIPFMPPKNGAKISKVCQTPSLVCLNHHLPFSFEEFHIFNHILMQEVNFQGHRRPWIPFMPPKKLSKNFKRTSEHIISMSKLSFAIQL